MFLKSLGEPSHLWWNTNWKFICVLIWSRMNLRDVILIKKCQFDARFAGYHLVCNDVGRPLPSQVWWTDEVLYCFFVLGWTELDWVWKWYLPDLFIFCGDVDVVSLTVAADNTNRWALQVQWHADTRGWHADGFRFVSLLSFSGIGIDIGGSDFDHD